MGGSLPPLTACFVGGWGRVQWADLVSPSPVTPPFEFSSEASFFGGGSCSPLLPSSWWSPCNSGASLEYGKFAVWGGDLGLLWPGDRRGAQASMRLGVLELGSSPPPTLLQAPKGEVLVAEEGIEEAHVSVHRCPPACGHQVIPAPGLSLAVPAPTACLGMNFLPAVS